MSDTQKRAIRTLLQAGLAALLIGFYQAFAPDAYKMNAQQLLSMEAFLTVVITFLQNWFENNVSHTAFLYGPVIQSPAEGKKIESEN
jgi:hypothetical protein